MTRRILIVDDDDDIRAVVQASLEEFGSWQAVTAASGAEGVTIAQTEALDAILLDISMPGMDGFQFCNLLQSDRKTQAIPVIVLTAKVLPRDRQRLTGLNVAGMIAKPFDPLTIWQEVAKILDWGR